MDRVWQGAALRKLRMLARKTMADVATYAGVRDLHPHRFRHTFACRYLQRNPGRLEHLRQLMGHATLAMTLRYARLAESDLEGAIEDWQD